MEINLLILGCLFILTLFTVGESIYKHFGINKYFALFLIAILFAGTFIPPLNIYGFELSFDKIIFPTIISFILLFKVRKFSRFTLSFLLCVFCVILYSLSGIEIGSFIIQPYMFMALGLGLVVAFVSYNLPSAICSIFFGLNIGSIIFNLTKYESLENMFLGTELFSAVLIAVLISVLVVFAKQKFSMLKQEEFEKYL